MLFVLQDDREKRKDRHKEDEDVRNFLSIYSIISYGTLNIITVEQIKIDL